MDDTNKKRTVPANLETMSEDDYQRFIYNEARRLRMIANPAIQVGEETETDFRSRMHRENTPPPPSPPSPPRRSWLDRPGGLR